MGQGIRTSLASAIADELEADWSYISLQQAIGDEKYGNQNTDGSRSVRTMLAPMRKMGATAKMMLIAAAAKKWNVSKKRMHRRESLHREYHNKREDFLW